MSSQFLDEKEAELSKYDVKRMVEYTKENPVWINFGSGDFFKSSVAPLQQELLNKGLQKSGIVLSDVAIQKLENESDSIVKTIPSVAEYIAADSSNVDNWRDLTEIFASPSLQVVSFTIGEKNYSLKDKDENILPEVLLDIQNGPYEPKGMLPVAVSLALARYNCGKFPVSFLSFDNFADNAKKLEEDFMLIAKYWVKKGFAEEEFLEYLNDKNKTSFPLSEQGKSAECGVASFIIEDSFPNGRPQFEHSSVCMKS